MSERGQAPPRAGAREDVIETVTVTRRYRRPPGGWWWLALALVPLLLALVGFALQDRSGSSGPAAPSSATTAPTPGATTTGPTPSASATGPTPEPSQTAPIGAIACQSFTKDVAGILAARPITFVSNGTTLTGSSRTTVAAVAQALKRCDAMAAVVTGHTDDTGTPAVNKTISAARAASVRSALVANGVAASRIGSVGAGQDRPIAPNDTEAGRAKNRRVEIVAN